MQDDRSPHVLLEELTRLPQGEELARLARAIAEKAAVARRREIAEVSGPLVRAAPVPREGNQTSFGDPIAALERGPQDRAERALLGALLARGISLSLPSGVPAEDRLAGELLWLSGHTGFDVFPALDAALGDRSAGLWGALCDLVRRIDAGREPTFDRADALVGASALRLASQPEVRAAAGRLGEEVDDLSLRAALRGEGGGEAPAAAPLLGELEPAPRGAFLTTLMAVTGLLLVLRGARLFARLALARKQPTEIEVSGDGVRIRTRTEILGKVTREAEHMLPAASLSRATREVRFPRLSLYAGLLSLALGSYVGVSLFVDGARAGSPSLLGQGLLIVAIGVGLELLVTTLFPGSRGRCRLLFVPRKGASVCVGELDIAGAQRALGRLSTRG